jgi:hypothetical protein
MQLSGMLLGLTVGPLAMPALIWATLTVDLPVALVITLIIVVIMSNCLSYITIRVCTLIEGRSNEAIGESSGEHRRWEAVTPQAAFAAWEALSNPGGIRAYTNLIHRFGREMRDRGQGAIIIVASGAGLTSASPCLEMDDIRESRNTVSKHRRERARMSTPW